MCTIFTIIHYYSIQRLRLNETSKEPDQVTYIIGFQTGVCGPPEGYSLEEKIKQDL